jgi:hypothetical protein
MKTKTSKMNALFGAMMAIFAVLFFSMLPAPSAQAGGPSKQPGLSIKQPGAVDSTEAIQQAETAKIFEADTTTQPPADVPPAGGGGAAIDIDWMLNKENLIASLVMLLLTFASKWFPGLGKITDTKLRALVVGLTVITGFLVVKFVGPGNVNWGDFASLGVTYLLTSLGYDKFLKPLGIKTPKAMA